MIAQGARASDRATALALSYYDAFNKGQWDALLALLADDVVHDVNQGWREVGKDQFRNFVRRTSRCYQERIGEICVLALADGRRAAAEYVVDGVYVESDPGLPPARGQKYHLRGGAFFEIANNKIARITNYYNLQDWLRQIAED
jgi:steroid delta-isomerase-like uncharacterized protein